MNTEQRAHRLKDIWRKGDAALGAWVMLGSEDAMEATARTGFDFICIDNQHGLADFERTLGLLRVIDLGSAFPLIRAASDDAGAIGRVLDAGAMGVIVPMINTAAQAAQVVAACRYAPTGCRSFGPLRVSQREGPDYFLHANDDVIVAVMIETAEALDCVDEIAATPGVDVLFVGPFDLSVSLGLPPGDNDGVEMFDAALAKVIAACRKYDRVGGVLATASLASRRAQQGFQLISVSMDFAALATQLNEDLEKARSTIEGPAVTAEIVDKTSKKGDT